MRTMIGSALAIAASTVPCHAEPGSPNDVQGASGKALVVCSNFEELDPAEFGRALAEMSDGAITLVDLPGGADRFADSILLAGDTQDLLGLDCVPRIRATVPEFSKDVEELMNHLQDEFWREALPEDLRGLEAGSTFVRKEFADHEILLFHSREGEGQRVGTLFERLLDLQTDFCETGGECPSQGGQN